jgi:hypothetical protein
MWALSVKKLIRADMVFFEELVLERRTERSP